MFKITIVIAALAVSASLAAHVPREQPDQVVYELNEQDSAGHEIDGLLESAMMIKAPKGLIGDIAGLIISKLSTLDAKALMKIGLKLSGLVSLYFAEAGKWDVSKLYEISEFLLNAFAKYGEMQ